MFPNKALERKILKPKKKTKKKVNIIDKAAKESKAEIAKQKVNYANARAQGDYAGMRVANNLANKARATQGAPAYSSAKGDAQFKKNIPKALPKANKARINNYVNTGIAAPKISNTPAYAKSYSKGDYLKGTGQLALSTLGAGADLLRNVSANAVSLTSGKGLQPYRVDYTKQQYENTVNRLTGAQPLYKRLEKINPTLSQMYLTTGEILEDPLNLFDAGAKLTANGLKKAGSAIYAQDLAKGRQVVLKSGKKINSVEDLKTLTPSEKIEVAKLNPTRKTIKNPYNNIVSQIDAEYQKAVDSVYDYIKGYKGKGTEINIVPKNGDELMRDGGIRYTNSLNDKWYQDFYKTNGRKPNKSELKDLAEKIVDNSIDNGTPHQEFYFEDLMKGFSKLDEWEKNKTFNASVKRINEQAPKQAVQPRKTDLGANLPKTELNGLQKDLGADVNKTNRTLADDIARSGELTESIPKNTPYGDVSRHAKTIKEGEQFSQGTVKAMLEDLKDGGFGKVTKTNAVAMQNANTKMKNVDDAYIKFKNVSAESKQPTSEDVALGYQLAKHYDNLGDYKKASEILEDTTFMLSETGRTLQAAKLAMKNSPLGRQRIATKIAKKITDKTGKQVELSNETLGKLYSAKTEKEIKEAFSDAKAELWNQVPPTFKDKFNAWRYTAMLGNARTVIRNETGNAVSYMMKQFKDTLGTGIERVALKQGDRTKAILTPIDRKLVKAGKEIATEYMDDLQGVGKYADINEGSRPQELPLFGQKNTLASKTIGKGVEAWRTTTNKALNEGLGFKGFKIIQGDEGWLTKVYGDSFAKVLKANKWTVEQVKKSPELFNQVHEIAKLEAQRATFRDASDFATAINRVSGKLRNSDNMLKKAAGYGIEGAMPFKKTPVNILKRSLEYSPVGLVESAYKFKKAVKDGASLADAIDRLSAGTVGTGTALIGAYLASQGILTVTIPDGKEGDFEKLQGKQAYALKVNVGGKDISLTLDWLVPSAVPMFLGAETYNSLSEKGASTSDIINSFADIADPVFEMSMLQGLANLVDVNSYGSGNAASTLGQMAGNLGFSIAGQTVPTALGQVARTIDPVDRRTNSSAQEGKLEKYVGYNLNKNIISKLPIINQNRQEYVDQWGRTQTKSSAKDYVRSGIENFLSPSYTNDMKTTAVDKEIDNVYKQNKNNEVLPSTYNKYNVTFKSEDYRMNGDQMEQYKKTKGQYAFNGLSKLFNTEAYKNMSTEEKEKAIKNVYDESNKKAKSEFLKTKGIDESKIWLNGLGKTTIAGYDAVKDNVTAESYYKDYYANQKSYTSNVAKSMAILANKNKDVDKAVLEGMDISKKNIAQAQMLLDTGITADEYTKIRKEANTDGGSLKKVEALVYMKNKDYSDKQRKAILRTI